MNSGNHFHHQVQFAANASASYVAATTACRPAALPRSRCRSSASANVLQRAGSGAYWSVSAAWPRLRNYSHATASVAKEPPTVKPRQQRRLAESSAGADEELVPRRLAIAPTKTFARNRISPSRGGASRVAARNAFKTRSCSIAR